MAAAMALTVLKTYGHPPTAFAPNSYLTSPTALPLILTRHYIRLPPALATEPTTTLLLITPNLHFLDLRFCATDATDLIWASTGTYHRTPHSGTRTNTHTSLPAPAVDHHTLAVLANGNILQTPASAASEEVWRPHPAEPRVVIVLATPGGIVVRVGGCCQGLLVVDGAFTVERWRREVGARWRRTQRVGGLMLPCSVACADRDESCVAAEFQGARYWRGAQRAGFVVEKTVVLGDEVVLEGRVWTCVERWQWGL